MERLTSNKSVSEMGMFELAHNSCYAKDGNARYRDYETDIDARWLAIKLLDKYADIPNEFSCEDDFDEFMMDSLQYGTGSMIGLIAIFYRNLWAMADLRERLAEYEDIGLTPEQLWEIDGLYAEKCKELAELEKRSFSGIEMVKIWANLQKLKEYKELEDKGKLLELPCTVGDMVYELQKLRKRIQPYEIISVKIGKTGYRYYYWEIKDGKGIYGNIKGFADSRIGVDVFLTTEEAEAALKEL